MWCFRRGDYLARESMWYPAGLFIQAKDDLKGFVDKKQMKLCGWLLQRNKTKHHNESFNWTGIDAVWQEDQGKDFEGHPGEGYFWFKD